MLDYVMILGVLLPTLLFVCARLIEILADYFGMIAFYTSWPFL